MSEQLTPYRPSNGTEGMYFHAAWCDACWKDRNQQCPILANTMLYDVDDPRYPKEWVCNDKHEGQCTAFLSYADHDAQVKAMYRPRPRVPKAQMRLL